MNIKLLLKGSISCFPFFLFVFTFLASCSNEVDNKLDLLYGITYKLEESQREVQKDVFVIERYKSIKSEYLNENLALYKVLKHPKYLTYLVIDTNFSDSLTISKKPVFDSIPSKLYIDFFENSNGKTIYAIYETLDKKEMTPVEQLTTIKKRFEGQ